MADEEGAYNTFITLNLEDGENFISDKKELLKNEYLK